MKKPMLSVGQLIQHMKSKGIQFTIMSESDAQMHLEEHNNYFKLSSYRKNYTKVSTGPNSGKYEFLEFAYLRELARLDTLIRHLLLEMSLDIEHFMKVALIKAVEDRMVAGSGEDGYKIITDFLLDEGTVSLRDRASNIASRNNSFTKKIRLNEKNPYCGGLINRYQDEMPIWAFVELISFGDLKDLIEYYSNRTGWTVPVDLMSLDRVRQLRNACAHGNAIINDLSPKAGQTNASAAPGYISAFLINAGVGKDTRKNKLANPRINQIVNLLYIYDKVVTSQNTRNLRLNELRDLIDNRMCTNKSYFQRNALLVSTYEFFRKICHSLN